MSACGAAPLLRSKLAQGYPASPRARPGLTLLPLSGRHWLAAALLAGAAALPSAACELLPLRPLAPGLWLVPAQPGDSDAANRGHVAHVLLASGGARLWALGSGPTPAFGARLRCTAERQLGRAPDDAVVPWAVAELALGAAGLGATRLWAHERVAAAMAEQCPHCEERLRQRLGTAAADLGDRPVRLPQRLLHGARGRWGPFDWWLLPRSAGRSVTVWRHRASGIVSAPGLLWGDGPPDLRDADVEVLLRALEALPRLGGSATPWVPQTGPLLDAAGVAAQHAYVAALFEAARRGVRSGSTEGAAPALPGAGHPRHALNWQRAWRQAEDDWLRGR